LLGGDYVSLSPGGSTSNLAPGQSFPVTQSAINIEDLLGKFIFSMGDMNSKPGASQGGGASADGGQSVGPPNPASLTNPNAGSSQGK
jgi:phospholipid/cholesterol/gamma-HCH transport system substrate-binding protein